MKASRDGHIEVVRELIEITAKFKIQKIEFDIIEKNINYIKIEYNGMAPAMKPFNALRMINTINPFEDENGRTKIF